MRKLLIVLFGIITLLGTFTGCRTAHGAGEDLENAGESIQRNTD